MRGVLITVLAALTIGVDRVADARDAGNSTLAITAQIHDYVHLPPALLDAASDVVTRIYKTIGVRIEWYAPIRQDPYGGSRKAGGSASPESSARRNPPDGSDRSDAPRLPIAQLTINVLKPEMARRGHIEEGVLGFAAVATDGGIGRIAYVIYDRIQQQASGGAIDLTELFGLVMAHEMGHLLLGPGSQGEAGLMKGHWNRDDLEQFQAITPRFSSREGEEIREALSSEAR
jgi:hypothetical protein